MWSVAAEQRPMLGGLTQVDSRETQWKKKRKKPHSKHAKVLVHNVCYHNRYYSFNGDLGALLIKMSTTRWQKPCRDLPEFELMRHLTGVFLRPLPQGLRDYPKLWSTSVSINFHLTLSRQAHIRRTRRSHMVELSNPRSRHFGEAELRSWRPLWHLRALTPLWLVADPMGKMSRYLFLKIVLHNAGLS